MPRRAARVGALLVIPVISMLQGCARNRPVSDRSDPKRAAADRRDAGLAADPTRLYQSLGFIATGEPLPLVGTVRYLAGPTPDTTLVLLAISMANRALSFSRDGDRFRASYQVNADLRQGGSAIRRIEARETVRVGSFRETSRGDESVIFHQVLSVAPGAYSLVLGVRDESAARTVSHESSLTVPRFAAGSISSPVPVYQAVPRAALDVLPNVVVSPRATVVFGQDSVIPVYLEGYGPSGPGTPDRLPIALAVRAEKGLSLIHI